jgi:hypothetical protein
MRMCIRPFVGLIGKEIEREREQEKEKENREGRGASSSCFAFTLARESPVISCWID